MVEGLQPGLQPGSVTGQRGERRLMLKVHVAAAVHMVHAKRLHIGQQGLLQLLEGYGADRSTRSMLAVCDIVMIDLREMTETTERALPPMVARSRPISRTPADTRLPAALYGLPANAASPTAKASTGGPGALPSA